MDFVEHSNHLAPGYAEGSAAQPDKLTRPGNRVYRLSATTQDLFKVVVDLNRLRNT